MGTNPVGESRDVGTLLHGERQVLEMIATGAPLAAVLDALCRVIDNRSGLMSAVFLVDTDGTRLTRIAGPHLPDAWRRATSSFPLTPTTSGACGAAVSRREQVIVSDVIADPLFESFQEAARAAGIGAAWSTPFYANDRRVLGTFAVVSPAPGPPSEQDLQLVTRATHLASIAVERHQAEEGLRESERRFSTAFYLSPACMVITRLADGRFLSVNDQFVTMFGYSREELIGQTALGLGLFVDPAQRSAFIALLAEHRARDVEAKARAKSGEILDLRVWMERIPLLGEECILAIACDVTDRKRAEEALARSERLLRLVLDALPVSVAVVDVNGDIVLSNPAARHIWSEIIHDGRERYARARAWWHDTGKELRASDWGSVRAVRDGETSVNEVIDIEAFDGVRKIVRTSAVPIRDNDGRITGAVIVNEDVSAKMAAEHARNESLVQMRALTGRLMRAQDDERRRIAQMLHETTAQDLAALKMHLARLNRTADRLSDSERSALTESMSLAEQSMTEIRTLSYLLHPPFLDDAGLLSALRWYAAGFAKRSGIKVDLDLPGSSERLPLDTETALFRIVQESLINIHRHAGSATARIRLQRDAETLVLEIEDQGRGISDASLKHIMNGGGVVGVGIPGMSERIEQLGGRLEITSSDRGTTGTTVRIRLPLAKDAP
jgi:two-component system NarL family sensor kinase